jgi:hypothetical protein
MSRIIGINQRAHEIELEDAAGWKLSGSTGLLAGWRKGDHVTIEPGDFYKVVKLTRNQSLTGSFIGFGSFVPGGGGTEAEPKLDPGPIAAKVVKEGFAGAYGAEWDAFHPAFKALVSRARFTGCERKAAKALGPLKSGRATARPSS